MILTNFHIILVLFSIQLNTSNSIYAINQTSEKVETNPAIWTERTTWGSLLEEWALHKNSPREKRVMQLPPAPGAYVADEEQEKESKISPGKIIVNNNNNNNDPQKKPLPGRQVSETDLYLLGAIEKLVHRADFMEKRLRRVEEMLFYVVAGNRIDQEPCPENFTRIAANCYLISSSAGREFDWKVASKQCKRVGAVLAELETMEENQDIITYIQSSSSLSGKDFWIGGLNPGLLWIWSNSARPVATLANSKNKKNGGIMGDGRCLRLSYDSSLRSYTYRGTDCSVRYSYICEIVQTTSSNELRRIGRNQNIIDEL